MGARQCSKKCWHDAHSLHVAAVNHSVDCKAADGCEAMQREALDALHSMLLQYLASREQTVQGNAASNSKVAFALRLPSLPGLGTPAWTSEAPNICKRAKLLETCLPATAAHNVAEVVHEE
eukprot:1161268-Pelagomonas_calceolata.AAC.9